MPISAPLTPTDTATACFKDWTSSTKVQLLDLPVELLQYTIRLAVPAPTPDNFSGRAEVARRLSLVCRLWRPLAQAELVYDITLDNVERAQAFLDGIGPWANGVRVLRLGSSPSSMLAPSDSAQEFKLAECLQRCNRIEQVWLRRMHDLSFELLFSSNTLRGLFIFGCHFQEDQEASFNTLPHLEYLYLVQTRLPQPMLPILNSTRLPSLRALAFGANTSRADDAVIDEDDLGEPVPITDLSRSLFPNLVALSASDNVGDKVCVDYSFFDFTPNLLFLDAWDRTITQSVASTLPTTLRRIRLCERWMWDDEEDDFADELNYAAPLVKHGLRLPNLEEFQAPACWKDDKSFDNVRAFCQARGVRLSYEPATEYSGFDLRFWDIVREIGG